MIRAMTTAIGSAAMMDTVCRLFMLFSENISAIGSMIRSIDQKSFMPGEESPSSFISLYFGEDVAEDDAQRAGALFEELCPGAEVAVLPGGQPVYYYIISME